MFCGHLCPVNSAVWKVELVRDTADNSLAVPRPLCPMLTAQSTTPTTPPKLRYFWQWSKTQQKVGWQKTVSSGRTTQGLGRFGKQVWPHHWTRVPGLGKGCTVKCFSKGVSGTYRAQDTRLGTCWLVYPVHDHNKIRLCCTQCCLCRVSRGNKRHQGSAVLRALLKCSIGLGFFEEIYVLFKKDQATGEMTNRAEEGTSLVRHQLNGINVNSYEPSWSQP